MATLNCVLCLATVLTGFAAGARGSATTKPGGLAGNEEKTRGFVAMALSGTLEVVDHVGPEIAVRGPQHLRENGSTANKILEDEMPGWPPMMLDLKVARTLELTAASDRAGSLRVARYYRARIDEELADYDAAPNAVQFLAALPENDRNTVRRLLQCRRDIQRLIGELRGQPDHTGSPTTRPNPP